MTMGVAMRVFVGVVNVFVGVVRVTVSVVMSMSMECKYTNQIYNEPNN